ncbi:MAG TPA: dTMP kinase [Micromonosporaceae bacterium]|nr:dTMP kinase [Micromonosporaceae bacterium]
MAGNRGPRIIALVGTDGSGKTTQAHGLAEWLTAHGRPARYWQNAGGRRWLGRLARRLGRPDGEALLGRAGMLAVEAVLRWLAIGRAVASSRLTGQVAVMDRYAVCQYASIRAHAPARIHQLRSQGRRPGPGGTVGDWARQELRRPGERLARAAYRVFPPPDVTFLLAVSPAEAYHRIEARGTDHEQLEFLTAAAAAYERLPEAATFVRVDADAPPDEVAAKLRAHLAVPLAPLAG